LVKTGRRLSLYQRAQKICTAVKSKFKTRMKNFYHDELVELPVQLPVKPTIFIKLSFVKPTIFIKLSFVKPTIFIKLL
jgi:hypothetical protein